MPPAVDWTAPLEGRLENRDRQERAFAWRSRLLAVRFPLPCFVTAAAMPLGSHPCLRAADVAGLALFKQHDGFRAKFCAGVGECRELLTRRLIEHHGRSLSAAERCRSTRSTGPVRWTSLLRRSSQRMRSRLAIYRMDQARLLQREACPSPAAPLNAGMAMERSERGLHRHDSARAQAPAEQPR